MQRRKRFLSIRPPDHAPRAQKLGRGHAARNRARNAYAGMEHVLGVTTPLLGALTLLDFFGLLAWTWLLFFWMSCGHWALYFYGAYPHLRHRPFVRGMFAFGVGLLWPVWLAAGERARITR